MPNYTYVCPICKGSTLYNHPMSETPEYKCTKCGEKLVKGFSAPLVTFKGNGWGHQS